MQNERNSSTDDADLLRQVDILKKELFDLPKQAELLGKPCSY